jgi:tRNA modification GTPase
MNVHDTIIAPASATGVGAITILRISGKRALEGLSVFFRPTKSSADFESHRLYYGHIVAPNSSVIDEVMAVYMAAPKTYTCEDVVEIHCHASDQIIKSILNLYEDFGFRLAAPGEFTYRAFINGRIDLSQAEAVAQLVQSKSESSHRLALSQLDGALSKTIYSFTSELKQMVVFFEAWIDFPEEDIPEEDINIYSRSVQLIRKQISEITSSFSLGRVLREGVSIVLVGQPNVGKSSLLNSLLGEDRAIVTSVPGTTRDLIEEGLVIHGLPVRLIDTAGLRDSQDLVEAEGIKRAEAKLENADLVLLLLDSSKEIDKQDQWIINRCSSLNHFVVWTKSDLSKNINKSSINSYSQFSISSKSGQGIDVLMRAISDYFLGESTFNGDNVILSERRHFESLKRCNVNLENFMNLVDNDFSLELLSFELREALYHLGQISGETSTEDLLTDIFSGFCIGK